MSYHQGKENHIDFILNLLIKEIKTTERFEVYWKPVVQKSEVLNEQRFNMTSQEGTATALQAAQEKLSWEMCKGSHINILLFSY